MLIYFSGNGNSESIAVSIAKRMGYTIVVALRHETIVNPHSTLLNVPTGEPVVWVFPVYSWGIPPVVVDFIRNCNLKCDGNNMHHLVVTCGDDTGLTATQWRRLMKERGWTARSATAVVMPNTYVLMSGFDTDSREVECDKLAASHEAVKRACERIAMNEADEEMLKGRFAWFKSRVIYPWFIRHAMSPKPFHALDSCTKCGKCSRECPMDNIAMTDGSPSWGNRCAMCLRCYHRCPHHAVAYGKATRGKHQYPGPEALGQSKC